MSSSRMNKEKRQELAVNRRMLSLKSGTHTTDGESFVTQVTQFLDP